MPRKATILFTLVGLATVPVLVLSQQPNPKGLTREQVAAIHGRVFRNEDVGAIPGRLPKCKDEIYLYEIAPADQRVVLEDPVAQLVNEARGSNLIVVGKMGMPGASRMTEGKGFLYTEWVIYIQDILMNIGRETLNLGEPITVVRQGGRLQIGNCTIHAVSKSAKEFKAGQEYVLFLRLIPETGAYRLWGPGALLSQDIVIPLEANTLNLRLRAMDKTMFLQAVKQAVPGLSKFADPS